MKKITILGIVFGLVGLSFLALASEEPARVMAVHSYDELDPCGKPQYEGFLVALAKNGYITGKNLFIENFYMDTKRTYTSPKEIETRAQLAIEKIENFKPNIIVTFDDDAFRTVGLKFANTSIPLVFSGLNGMPEDYNTTVKFMESRKHPGGNVTGIYEFLHVKDALMVHTKLFPNTRKILFVVDNSNLGNVIKKQIYEELIHEKELPYRWELKVANSWEEYKSIIDYANKNEEIGAIYPAALKLANGQKKYASRQIIEWTVANSRKPEIALNHEFVRLGYFGGAVVDFFSMGQQAGEMVSKILKGESPANIPIEDAKRFILVFNITRAIQLGLEIPEEFILAAEEIVYRGNQQDILERAISHEEN